MENNLKQHFAEFVSDLFVSADETIKAGSQKVVFRNSRGWWLATADGRLVDVDSSYFQVVTSEPKPEHTPLPWRQVDYYVADEFNGVVADCDATHRSNNERLATAAFITKACNLHYELVDALRNLYATYESADSHSIHSLHVSDLKIISDALGKVDAK